jgi:hypothetical protein
MNSVTPLEIPALVEKLHDVMRELQSVDPNEHPFFVLIAKSREDRLKAEGLMFQYFVKKYGFSIKECLKLPYDVNPLKNSSTFRFPNGVRITIIDQP